MHRHQPYSASGHQPGDRQQYDRHHVPAALLQPHHPRGARAARNQQGSCNICSFTQEYDERKVAIFHRRAISQASGCERYWEWKEKIGDTSVLLAKVFTSLIQTQRTGSRLLFRTARCTSILPPLAPPPHPCIKGIPPMWTISPLLVQISGH